MGSRPSKLDTPTGYTGASRTGEVVGTSTPKAQAFQHYHTFLTRLDASVRSQMWKAFVDQSSDEVVLFDDQLSCTFVNSSVAKNCKLPVDAMVGMSVDVLPGGFHTETYRQALRQAASSAQSSEQDIEWSDQLGQTHCRAVKLWPLVDHEGRVSGVLSVSRDITAMKEAERKLGAAQVIASLSYWEWDYRNGVLAGTRLGKEVLGLSGEPLTAAQYRELIPPEDNRAIDALYVAAFKQGCKEISYEHGLVFPDGTRREMQNWVRIEYGNDGRAVRAIGVTQDVTRFIALQKQTHKLAFYDPLTELPNRMLLQDKLQAAIALAASHEHNVGVVLLDIDHFQKVNDSMGYGSGDILLKVIGDRLANLMRDSDTVARLGGDEFAIVLHHIRKPGDIDIVMQRVRQVLDIPVPLQGSDIIITASAGIALFPQDGRDASELMAHADAAMFHAKGRGRNNFQFYAREITANTQERVQIENDLRKALERDELELFYQPKIDISSGEIIGAEALMRWRHPKRGLVPPDKFIGVAEETGLIVDMGQWALRTALRTAKEWNSGRANPLNIAVNLSPRQFYSGNLVATVQQALKDTGAAPQWLELEITESLLLSDHADIKGLLRQLHDLGMTIAIDDFGTGYSSLSYLTHFPVDTLKIDRSFVRDMMSSPNGEELVRAIVALGHSLHMRLVAEGIEDKDQRDRLLSFGCRFAQGYLYSKPVPSAEFTALMNVHARGNVAIIET